MSDPTEQSTTAIELVWATTRRSGLDFHDFDHPRTDRTSCGRYTKSVTSVTLTLLDATSSGMKPCARCWPLGLPANVQPATDTTPAGGER